MLSVEIEKILKEDTISSLQKAIILLAEEMERIEEILNKNKPVGVLE